MATPAVIGDFATQGAGITKKFDWNTTGTWQGGNLDYLSSSPTLPLPELKFEAAKKTNG